MLVRAVILALLFLPLCTARSGSLPPTRCAPKCNFKICGYKGAVISSPDFPATRSICLRRRNTIGRIRRVGEARLRIRGTPRSRISATLVAGRSTFPRHTFAVVDRETGVFNTSAVRVAPLPRHAARALQGACVVLPVLEWVEGARLRRGFDCVAFRVAVPSIVVELVWGTRDDLDLFVTEPDGRQVFFQQHTETGRLLRDVNRNTCKFMRRTGGTETVVYMSAETLQTGNYTVFAEHTRSCQQGPTDWEVRVIVEGVVRRRLKGVSELTEGGLIPGSLLTFAV